MVGYGSALKKKSVYEFSNAATVQGFHGAKISLPLPASQGYAFTFQSLWYIVMNFFQPKMMVLNMTSSRD